MIMEKKGIITRPTIKECDLLKAMKRIRRFTANKKSVNRDVIYHIANGAIKRAQSNS